MCKNRKKKKEKKGKTGRKKGKKHIEPETVKRRSRSPEKKQSVNFKHTSRLFQRPHLTSARLDLLHPDRLELRWKFATCVTQKLQHDLRVHEIKK